MGAVPAQKQALQHLGHLRRELNAIQGQPDGSLGGWAKAAGAHAPLLKSVLPTLLFSVWLDLLDRVESSALFDAESCSFSQSDLMQLLNRWLDKAIAHLSTATH